MNITPVHFPALVITRWSHHLCMFRELTTDEKVHVSYKTFVKMRLNFGNACYHLFQNIFTSRLSKNVKIGMYESIILLLFLYECETRSRDIKGGT
jgi:hypothetical protein